ncbi:hypothetical protein J4Q44_G00375090 [Coregonus suidteri]|uniref:Uncharacterized protein n=1 Tax=Coregonus suidteri TaxID=861788 RepID=A0AAN8Q4T6_9TELE
MYGLNISVALLYHILGGSRREKQNASRILARNSDVSGKASPTRPAQGPTIGGAQDSGAVDRLPLRYWGREEKLYCTVKKKDTRKQQYQGGNRERETRLLEHIYLSKYFGCQHGSDVYYIRQRIRALRGWDGGVPTDGASFRVRSQSAPPALWAAKKYGRQLRRMSDEFDTWLDKGEMRRVKSAGAAKQMTKSPSWWAYLFSHQETETEHTSTIPPRSSE